MEEKILEQPQAQSPAQPNTDSENVEEKTGAEGEVLEGSFLSKFKTTESLVQAYENLQAEFTRKSQKLSEVKKELATLKENATSKAPFYEAENYEKMVETFFQNNPSAKEYASEISELLMQDKVQKSAQPLEVAWAKILENKLVNLEDTLQQDEQLFARVLNNKTVQESVIKNYLQGLTNQKTIPVISTHNGTGVHLTPKQKPLNLEEAKALAEALFKI